MTIYFYKTNEKYGCFSNFAHYGFALDEKWWMTSEHYFQAQKFYGTEYVEIIRLLDNPMKAAKMGRNRNLPLREDWEEVKDNTNLLNKILSKRTPDINNRLSLLWR